VLMELLNYQKLVADTSLQHFSSEFVPLTDNLTFNILVKL
jgi:hypothetical protein